MEIIIAETAGFCFGVSRAIDTVYESIDKSEQSIYTLGPIIHNQQVVDDLRSKGVGMIESIKDIPDSSTKLIIRTHGIGKTSYTDLESNKIEYIDATCPFVRKIHRIVEKYYNEGYEVIIVGDRNHPEVIGINGWCENSAVIANSIIDIQEKLKCSDKTCVVAQTTINREKWDQITDYIKLKCENAVIFDTICSATNARQVETEKIAKQVDMMVVIGGKHSSNTQKLAEICRKYCNATYHIETFEELPQNITNDVQKIGITAGASTPAWIIKEVVNKMSEKENLQNQEAEMSFAEAFEQSLVTLNTGDIVKGTVIGVSENEVYVDLGFKSDGVIKASELTDDPSLSPADMVKVGDKIEVFIIRVDDGEGNVLLSKKKIDSIKGWEAIESALESKKTLTGKVIEAVNGGIIVLVNGSRVFVPASQASNRYITDLNQLLKREVNLRIIDINKKKRRTVGSIRVVMAEEQEKKSEEFWSTAEIGKKYTGTVKKLTDFGAFVDLGGVDGLVHISELSWKKIKHPSQVLKEGDIAEVYILELDKDKNRISLGFKKSEDNPWAVAKSKFAEGDVVKCKVVRMVPFGAFVELIPGVDGLIHISQISNKRIGKPEDVLTIGQTVEAKITALDLDNQKVSLSIRELLGEPEPQTTEVASTEKKEEPEIPAEYREDVKVTIGDVLNNKNDNE